jgi:uncharacterized membrane protein YdfJ with MMPL/SSD domain
MAMERDHSAGGPAARGPLASLGRAVAGRPWTVLALVALLGAVSFGLAGGLSDRLHPFGSDDPASENARADDELRRATGLEPEVGFLALVPGEPRRDTTRDRIRRIERILARHPAVGQVRSALDDPRRLVSRDRRASVVTARMRPVSQRDQEEAADELSERVEALPGVRAGGRRVLQNEVNTRTREGLARAEAVALPLILLISVVFFRGLVAALLPPLLGVLAIAMSLLVVRGAAELTEISSYALNLITALGLGLSIDYTLLIVSRYREELERVGPGPEALARTLATAGRTVAFSGITIAAALASLLVFPAPYLYSMGLGGAMVALLACALGLVVLPAVLALLGPRVNALAPGWLQRSARAEARPATSGPWYRLSRFVMRRPVVLAVATAAVLLLVASPVARIDLTTGDSTIVPEGTSVRDVTATLREDFPRFGSEPMRVVVHAPPGRAVDRLAADIRGVPGVRSVERPRRIGRSLSTLAVLQDVAPLTERGQDVARAVRELPSAVPFEVAGRSAEFVDEKESLAEHLPQAVLLLVASTLLALFAMTGSVVLPVKTLVLNALTVCAALGPVVFVFQDGRLEGLLGYTSEGGVDISQPVLLGAIVFGLSTDYGIFLLERIREARGRGLADREAVPLGLERTGRIVTAAALLFSVAMGALITNEIVLVKELSFGIVFAVLVDATLVRALLVPALMALLGARNWWAPPALKALHRRLRLDPGGVPEPRPG